MNTSTKNNNKKEEKMNGTSKYVHERVEVCISCENELTYKEKQLDVLFCGGCSTRSCDDYSNNHEYIHDSNPLDDIIFS